MPDATTPPAAAPAGPEPSRPTTGGRATPADSPAGRSPHRPTFEERLWPGPLGWGLTASFGLLLGVVLVPVSVPLAVTVAVVGLTAALGAMVVATPRVAVVDGLLLAGRARIPVDLLGDATVLDRAGVRAAMGPELDARAYVCLRAWVGSAVRVEVVDEQDPTPYWVVSTRHPQELLVAIGQARGPRS